MNSLKKQVCKNTLLLLTLMLFLNCQIDRRAKKLAYFSDGLYLITEGDKIYGFYDLQDENRHCYFDFNGTKEKSQYQILINADFANKASLTVEEKHAELLARDLPVTCMMQFSFSKINREQFYKNEFDYQFSISVVGIASVKKPIPKVKSHYLPVLQKNLDSSLVLAAVIVNESFVQDSIWVNNHVLQFIY
ncbi:MAG TPA: hypothetical protein PL009_03580 [Flavipsychrobacter sp.]|nr:hypothetical protein [Flavipsychrobacter sp.]